MKTPADQHVRDRIRTDLDTTLVVEAAAGTGKTTALVNRIIAAVASGRARLGQIVAVTFTEKAAGELKLRLRAEIERARQDPALDGSARERLSRALPQLEEARIGTIHSFCADLIRERPVEARVDPMFEVAAEDKAEEIFELAFERWFQRTLANPGEGMRRLLRRRDLAVGDGPRPIARAAAGQLREWRDFDAPWTRWPFERNREIDELVAEIEHLGRLARQGEPDDYLAQALDNIARPVAEATRLEPLRGRDYDALEQVLIGLLRGNTNPRFGWRGYGERFGEHQREEVTKRREALHERLARLRMNAGANLAPLLRDEIWPVVGEYEELKRRAGVLDFLDLLLLARNLVRDNPVVRRELQERFTHIFVDEFQDTDPLQAEILFLLSADDPGESDWKRVRPVAGKLFIVGDPKQSIYRFRRADVSLYQSIKRRLAAAGASIENLAVSFRAVPELQEMVNAAFAPLMAEESDTQPAYVALKPFRDGVDSQPSAVVLPVPAPYGDFGRVSERKIEESLPEAVAAFVEWLLGRSGWTVTERDASQERVPIRPRHVCILFRRLNSFGRDVTRAYIRALEARHLPHVLVKGGSFNEREEVEAIRNLLGAIERPDDELLVFASLRGPVFALSDAALLEFRETLGSLHPFRRIPDDAPETVKEVGRALALLRELHRGRNRRPVAATISRLLAATRAHGGFAIWPTGEQALGNVMKLMDMARRYEARSGAASFRGFVDELEARAERAEAGEVPVVEEGTEGIRIMTVHRAKGLEFPVVILADMTCKETRAEPSHYVDPARRLAALELAGCAPVELQEHAEDEARREREEAARVLYVAATRARELLVVPAVGDEEREGWLAGLNPVIFPENANRRAPLTRKPPGCPAFGDDSVLVRGPKAPLKEKSVAPGTHRARAGTHRVVWWDPSLLNLDVRETMGLRQMRLLEADSERTVATGGIRAWQRWRDAREAAIARGLAPSLRVGTASELAAATDTQVPEADEVALEEAARIAGRPHGLRFGTLVHLTMLRVRFDAGRDEIVKVTAWEARTLGADDAEIAAAAQAVARALAAPLMRRAARSLELRRECPLVMEIGGGVRMEGVADLAFRETDGTQEFWTVVDFKTDVDIAPRLGEYRKQVGLYLRAIRKATGLNARGSIFLI